MSRVVVYIANIYLRANGSHLQQFVWEGYKQQKIKAEGKQMETQENQYLGL